MLLEIFSKTHFIQYAAFLEFFIGSNVCLHDKVTPDMEHGYCPDCGEYIQNQWFITRCACCGIKHKAKVIKDNVSADAKFCKNCGHGVFVIEKLSKINFVDVHYAALVKKIIQNFRPNLTQSWSDNPHHSPKLLPCYKNIH